MVQRRTALAFNGFGAGPSRTPPRHAARTDPRRFGRGRTRVLGEVQQQAWRVSDDLKLFAGTFAAGFVFVSILIA